MSSEPPVVRDVEQLTARWLERALQSGRITSFESQAIGTGQMSQSHRVKLEYAASEPAGPASVFVKTAALDPTSRATGVGLGVYEREVRFYRELAPRVGGSLPACHLALLDPVEGWFTLVLEDSAPAVQGDQIAGCDVDRARLAILELARIHAPVFADPQLGATPWLNQETPLNQALMSQLLPAFMDRYGDRVEPEHRDLCERLLASLDGWIADRRPPLGLVHGDYRLDNMLFGQGDGARPLTIVDWQTVGWGPVMTDVSYFLGGGLSLADRRSHEQSLVREYHSALAAEGVRGFSWDDCWTGYRRQCFAGVLMTVAPAMLVERTERGDEMFLISLARYAQQALDLDAPELLPARGSSRPAFLRPAPAEERPHAIGPELLWSESWYFDAVSEDGSVGVWTRLGAYPNLGVCWMTAFVCAPDRPTAAVIDFQAPLPDGDDLVIETDALRAEHLCEAPLERFRVRLEATGELHEDAAALLRGGSGSPVAVALDLVWETLGEPYAYRVATRYEIPCRVSGSVRVGQRALKLRAVGQRDHSWGVRDWWSADWMWCAGHLQDGTRFHGVELRLPDAPRLGVGYLQPPDGGLLELDMVSAREELAEDGLITAAQVRFGPDEAALSMRPLAFGPLRLIAPDGRVTSFPRAMCEVTASDGRRGVAWMEWNRNPAR